MVAGKLGANVSATYRWLSIFWLRMRAAEACHVSHWRWRTPKKASAKGGLDERKHLPGHFPLRGARVGKVMMACRGLT